MFIDGGARTSRSVASMSGPGRGAPSSSPFAISHVGLSLGTGAPILGHSRV